MSARPLLPMLAFAGLAALAACADERPAVPVLPPETANAAAPPRVSGPVGSEEAGVATATSLVASAPGPHVGTAEQVAEAGPTVVPLRYAGAEQLAKVLQPFVGSGGAIAPAAGANAVLVSGDATARQTLAALIQAFDIEILAGQSYAVLPAGPGEAKDTATALQAALRTGGEASARLRVLPLDRIDAVLVAATSPAALADAQRLFGIVQRGQRQEQRRWRVVYLQNSDADDIAYVLQQAFTPDDVTAQPHQIASTSPLAGNAGIGGNPIAPPTSPSRPSAGGGRNDSALRIVPDDPHNALLIYATPQEQDSVVAALRKLDIVPDQVRIDAVIAEVTLDDQLQYGTQFFFKSGGINGILNNASATVVNPVTTVLGASFPGFLISGSDAGGAPLAISALQAVTRLQVVSSPQLTVVDNQAAHLQVGSLVPYLTASSQSTLLAGAPVINSVGYQPTGVILDIRPRIGSSGQVMLEITQNLSDVATATVSTGGIDSPTFDQRRLDSRIVMQDGQTLGIAGLVTDNVSRENTGIPWLKDVPLLGFLAGTQTTTRTRVETLILVTPHVLRTPVDLRAAAEELRLENINAAQAADALRHSGQSGSADPGRALRRRLDLER